MFSLLLCGLCGDGDDGESGEGSIMGSFSSSSCCLLLIMCEVTDGDVVILVLPLFVLLTIFVLAVVAIVIAILNYETGLYLHNNVMTNDRYCTSN